MPMNVNRWLKYAKAKLDDTLASGNQELDQLEDRQKAERADRPWLASDSDAPTFGEAKARIAWEAEQAGRSEPAPRPDQDRTGRTPDAGPTGTQPEPDRPNPVGTAAPGLPTDPLTDEEAAERSSARIVLDQRAEESAARLAQIRAELGVDDPAPPPA